MAAVVALAGTTLGWVTQVQSNSASRPRTSLAFGGTLKRPMPTTIPLKLGYYWHYPALADDNRVSAAASPGRLTTSSVSRTMRTGAEVEDTFKEDFFFAKFVTCVDIRASGPAFKTWTDVQPQLRFVDVTEECRRIHGGVYSNCSLVELFITHRDNNGVIPGKMQYMGTRGGEPSTVGHPKPWPNAQVGSGTASYNEGEDNSGSPFPAGSIHGPFAVNDDAGRPSPRPLGISDCSVVGTVPKPGGVDGTPTGCDAADAKWYANRNDSVAMKKLADIAADTDNLFGRRLQAAEVETARRHRRQLEAAEEIFTWESMAGVAASALQFGRYADVCGPPMEWFRGRAKAPSDRGLWRHHLLQRRELLVPGHRVCGPLHQLKAKMGTNGAAAMIKGIAFGIFAALLVLADRPRPQAPALLRRRRQGAHPQAEGARLSRGDVQLRRASNLRPCHLRVGAHCDAEHHRGAVLGVLRL